MTEEMRHLRAYAFVLSGIMVCVFLCWLIRSHFEASTYTELTGRAVSTWQAMWVELRVIEPARED